MGSMLDTVNLIAAALTIASVTVSLVLWVRTRERHKWIYANYQTVLEGLTNIVIYTRSDEKGPPEVVLQRVGDMAFNLHDNVVSALLTLDRRRTERLKSWNFGFKDEADQKARMDLVSAYSSSTKYGVYRSEIRSGR